jgi:hypothetical protein
MTSFMMPHVYGRLMHENLNLVMTNGFLQPKINHTLAKYLSMSIKASEQYCETWEPMSKLTDLYDSLGEKPRIHYETQEMLKVFKLSPSNTSLFTADDADDTEKIMVKHVLESIYTCKKGNNSIIKTGNIFSQAAVDCIYILSLSFNEVYIYKPASSPAILSEKYVICKDFKLINTDYLNETFRFILNHLRITKTLNCISLYTRRINSHYITTLIEANSVIGQQQLEAINNTITLIEQGKKKERIEALKRQQVAKCSEWHKKFGVNGQHNSKEIAF